MVSTEDCLTTCLYLVYYQTRTSLATKLNGRHNRSVEAVRRRWSLKTGLLTQTSFLQHCKNAKKAEKGLKLHVYVYDRGNWLMSQLLISSIFLLVVESWNRQHHGQTIHPTEKLILMNVFKILCAVTWLAWLFLTSMVMEAVRGQKRYSECTLWHFNSMLVCRHSSVD